MWSMLWFSSDNRDREDIAAVNHAPGAWRRWSTDWASDIGHQIRRHRLSCITVTVAELQRYCYISSGRSTSTVVLQVYL